MAERRAAYAGTWELFERETAGQYASRAESEAAYAHMASGSPWPQGYTPVLEDAKVGEYVNIAMGPGQRIDQPGAFATKSAIRNVKQVRDKLAVKYAFKKEVGFVQRYRVIKTLPVMRGPIGPQLDTGLGRLLKGGGSQVEFKFPDVRDASGKIVKYVDRMEWLKPVGRPKPIK